MNLDHGTVEITLDGEIHTLKPTLKAVQLIERQCNGLVPALTAVQNMATSTMALVIGAGLGLPEKKLTGKAFEQLSEQVWKEGIELRKPLSDYLLALMNPRGTEPTEGKPEAETPH